ncbi:hypothetical protein CPB85DRAFT_1334682 [Mucidula mucida]|nr:hypothetical protein CPB85DRAFT_1334644 [Mucidula mucida]KAF8888429.1 hypothetical protein CPB85DRAFT_1334682 [Mucidula mucida]
MDSWSARCKRSFLDFISSNAFQPWHTKNPTYYRTLSTASLLCLDRDALPFGLNGRLSTSQGLTSQAPLARTGWRTIAHTGIRWVQNSSAPGECQHDLVPLYLVRCVARRCR